MKDLDKYLEQIEPERMAILKELYGRIKRWNEAHELLDYLLEMDKEQEAHRATVKFGIWTWQLASDHVVFERRRLRNDGSIESKHQFSGKWREIVHREDLDRITKHLHSFLERDADTDMDNRYPLAWDWDSIRKRLAGTYIYIRTVDQEPLIVRCRALDILESNTTVIGDYVNWSPLLGSLPLPKPSVSFDQGLLRHFVPKSAPEESLELEEIFRTAMSRYPSSSMILLYGDYFRLGCETGTWLEERESDFFGRFLDSAYDERGAVFTQDHERRYTYASPAMTNLLDLRVSEILGKTDEELFDGRGQWRLRMIEPEGPEKSWYHKVIRRGDNKTPSELRLATYWRGPSAGRKIRYWGEVAEPSDIEETIESEGGETEHKSRAMLHALELARLVANTDSIVLLTGESGVGKDHMAGYIHELAHRPEDPYFDLNCATIQETVAESELFGYEEGGHSEAKALKRGLLEQAEGGTLLLNEIGDLPLPIQTKLLTFLDTKKITRVGGTRKVTVNARLIAATNKDLEERKKLGLFRQDLFYRLNVFPIHIPPLRERKEEIPALAAQLWHKHRTDMRRPDLKNLDPAVLKTLMDYDWPGNVRELSNVLEKAVILGRWTMVGFPFPRSRSDSHSPGVEERSDADTHLTRSNHLPTDPALRPMGDLTNEEFIEMYNEKCVKDYGEERFGMPGAATAIGEFLKCTRETVSRRIKRLKLPGVKQGPISKDRKNEIILELQSWANSRLGK